MREYWEMTDEEFVLTFKHFIEEGKRYFVPRSGAGYDYLSELYNLGIENIHEAWDCLMTLKLRSMVKPREPDRSEPTIPVFFFKQEINGKVAYIKVKLCPRRGAVCLSLHEDR